LDTTGSGFFDPCLLCLESEVKKEKEKEMKRLIYVTHANMDDKEDEVGPGGLDFALAVGFFYRRQIKRFTIALVFHGPHVCTAQTAASFITGHGHVGRIAPIVTQIGSKKLLSEIYSPSTFRAVAVSAGNIQAMHACHEVAKVAEWTEIARGGVSQMFAQLKEGELGVAFGHGPVIDLAIASVLGTDDLPEQNVYLGAMEGFELVQNHLGRVKMLGKVFAL